MPAVRNRVPLPYLSPTPLPNSTINATLASPCSLLAPSQFQLHSLYDHLNLSSCQWQFSAWYPVSILLERCGGQRLATNQHGLNITAVSTYLDVEAGRAATMTSPSLTAATISNPDLPSPIMYLPPPLHILPQNSRQDLPYLFPISLIQGVGESASLKVLFYLKTREDQQLLPSNHSEYHPTQLYQDEGITVWELELHPSFQPVLLIFSPDKTAMCTQCEQHYIFNLPLARKSPPFLLNISSVLQQTLIIGKKVELKLLTTGVNNFVDFRRSREAHLAAEF